MRSASNCPQSTSSTRNQSSSASSKDDRINQRVSMILRLSTANEDGRMQPPAGNRRGAPIDCNVAAIFTVEHRRSQKNSPQGSRGVRTLPGSARILRAPCIGKLRVPLHGTVPGALCMRIFPFQLGKDLHVYTMGDTFGLVAA